MSPTVASLRSEIETALARFTLVEPVTIEDLDTIAKHLRFALHGAKVEATRIPWPSREIGVIVWRDGAVARVVLKIYANASEATKARGI